MELTSIIELFSELPYLAAFIYVTLKFLSHLKEKDQILSKSLDTLAAAITDLKVDLERSSLK